MEGETQLKRSSREGRPQKETTDNIIKFPEVWMEQLNRNSDGKILNTIGNFILVLKNDEEFKEKLKFNEFTEENSYDNHILDDYDICFMRAKIEEKYKIHSKDKLNDAIEIVARENKYHPIKEYLEGLKWDGIKRADTTFADYFGAEKSEYNAMCIRLIILGAIERIYEPGVKFDPMVILKGGQGLGKSTFFSYICGDDSCYQGEFQAKDLENAYYKTRGKWIVEMAELSAMKKSDQEVMKQFITLRKDTYNIKYKRTPSTILRQFVFIGTTNKDIFLTDDTGERRFPIVELADKKQKFKKKIFPDEGINVEERNKQYEEIKYEISQITAEIYHEWKNGTRLYDVPSEFQDEMIKIQSNHKSEDEDSGIIESYLENQPIGSEVCIKMVWCEAFKHPFKDKVLPPVKNKIVSILNNSLEWKEYDGSKDGRKDFKDIQLGFDYKDNPEYVNYGKQKCWVKVQPELEKILEEKNKINNGIKSFCKAAGIPFTEQDYSMTIGGD